MRRIAVTGADGFIGSRTTAALADRPGVSVRALVRRTSAGADARIEQLAVGDLSERKDWGAALDGVDAVIHLAARVHVMRDRAPDALAECRRVNVAASLGLARAAAAAGARRFVYVSSVKVNGERGRYTEADVPAPEDPYGVSKHEAEVGLREVASATGLEVAIVRPPLVYGPGVKANFRTLMRAIAAGIPLPLGALDNRRSLVALDNLVGFLLTVLDHPGSANETFLVSDGEDLSTTDLVVRLARAMGRPPRLIPVPARVLMTAATLVGRQAAARRLVDSLQVDTSKARRRLGWVPPISVDEGLQRAVVV